MAMTDAQRRWFYLIVAAIVGGAVGFLFLWALG
jgi:nitrogen fixation-related uncharacterized protein